jgi:hypothetical protein
MISNECHARSIGYGCMLLEALVAVVCLLAACALHPGDYYAINVSPAVYEGLTQTLGLHPVNLDQLTREVGEQTLVGRTGGAVSLAVGMAQIFSALPGLAAFMKYWYHFAAGIGFQRVGDHAWVMTLRPERHLTTDGKVTYNPRYVGRRVTSLKARMYNDKYLDEVHFWRYFLGGGKPDIHLAFGHQHILVDAELLAYDVDWPGTEGDTKEFSNIRFADDLFTFAERRDALEDDLDEELGKESEED